MKKQARSSLPWQELQPELLGLVLLRLPSLIDRVRLRAVCRTWRSNARLQPLPPPLPWLSLLDGTSLSIPDGKLVRIPAPDDGAFCCGSADSSLFFVHGDGRCSLVNPFSKSTLELPKVAVEWFDTIPRFGSSFQKMVACSPLEPDPSQAGSSLAVAMILDNGGIVGMCRPTTIASSLSITGTSYVSQGNHRLHDIAFFNGKLYGLGNINRQDNQLCAFDMNHGLDGKKPKISRVKCITRDPSHRVILPKALTARTHLIKKYLVECGGRLLMVTRRIEVYEYNDVTQTHEYGPTAAFEVFEADLSRKPGRWRCLHNLGGQHALFVGKHGSKSLPAGGCTGIQEDCVYFMCDYRDDHPTTVDPLHDAGAYNMRNGSITPLLSEGVAAPQHRGGQWRPTWVFPADR